MRTEEYFTTRTMRSNKGRSTFVVTDRGTLPRFLGEDGQWHNAIDLVREADFLVNSQLRDGEERMPALIGTSNNVSFEQIVDLTADGNLDDIGNVTRHWTDITGGFLDYAKVGSFVRDAVGMGHILDGMSRNGGKVKWPARLTIRRPRGRFTDPDIVEGKDAETGKRTKHRRIKQVGKLTQSYDHHGQIVQYGDQLVERKVIRRRSDVYGVYLDPKEYREVWRLVPTETVFVGLKAHKRSTAIKRAPSKAHRKAAENKAKRNVETIALMAHGDLDYITDGFNKATADNPAVLVLDTGTLTINYGKGNRRVKYVPKGKAPVSHIVRNPRAIARWIARIEDKPLV